jgi:Ca-activated chloride channel family protein
MTKKSLWLLCTLPFLLYGPGPAARAQEAEPHIRVVVNMVQLNVAVTDDKGNYVTGLKPKDFVVAEDGIRETIATFAEGNAPAQRLVGSTPEPAAPAESTPDTANLPASVTSSGLASLASGANVFILFDTSNYMYRGFVFAQDAIADFVRSLDNPHKIALYSYSRDLSRVSRLTSDRNQVLRSVRSTVAGDDAALYNCLLLTVKDASHYIGRKVVVVF